MKRRLLLLVLIAIHTFPIMNSYAEIVTNALALEFIASEDPDGDSVWFDRLGSEKEYDFLNAESDVTVEDSLFRGIIAAYTEGSTSSFNYDSDGLYDASFELWIDVGNLNAGQEQVIFEAGGASRGVCVYLSDNTLTWNVDGDSSDYNISKTLSSTGLVHVVGVIDLDGYKDNQSNDTFSLYVDGDLVQTQVNVNIDDWSGSNISGLGMVGSSTTGAQSSPINFHGGIALYRFYKKALSPAEVEQNYEHAEIDANLRVYVTGIESYAPSGLGTDFWKPTRTLSENGVLYGMNRVNSDGTDGLANGQWIRWDLYRSYDNGQSWTFLKTAIDRNDHHELADCRFISNKWFKTETGNYALYAKHHYATTARKNLICIWSATIDGDYQFAFTEQPYGYTSGDLGIMNDGNIYIISAATTEGEINIFEVNDRGDDLAAHTANLHWTNSDGSEDHREAPDLFKKGNYYFITTSGKTGWKPNQQKYAYASSITGPWSDMINLGDETGYHSQLFYTAFVSGSEESNHIFSSTRNSPMWGGTGGSQAVHLPMYFNTETNLATNYYDEVWVNKRTGVIKGYHYDHGRELDISSVSLEGYSDDISAIIDGDETTSWLNGNTSGKNTIIWDLGSSKLVKAIKLMPEQYTTHCYVVDIYVGDGSNWTKVFAVNGEPPVVPMTAFLGPIDLVDTQGRYVKIVQSETRKDGKLNNSNRYYFGFYESEIWGETMSQTLIVDENFNGSGIGSAPSGWSVTSSATNATALVAAVPSSSDRSLHITDTTSSGKVVIEKSFTAQKGSLTVLEFDVMFDQIGTGEYIRLKGGSDLAIDLVNSMSLNALAMTDSGWNHTKLANIQADQWYRIRVEMNTDTDTFDLYLDNEMIWGGGLFRADVNRLDKILIGTSNAANAASAYFDNVTIDGVIP